MNLSLQLFVFEEGLQGVEMNRLIAQMLLNTKPITIEYDVTEFRQILKGVVKPLQIGELNTEML